MPSKSKTQQRLMGVAYAVKSGDMQLSDVDVNYKDKVKDLVDGMTLKQLKDFAETKHDGLPEEVEEGISPANIGGMGEVSLPTDSQPGSGDVPAGRKSKDDEEDKEKQLKKMKKLIPAFENFIRPSEIDEARDFNDPVLMKMRAAQMKLNQKAAKKNDEASLSPAKAKKIQALKDERKEIMRDMEQEAEMEGGEIADRYGDMLNKIDKQIIKLGGNPLSESEVNELRTASAGSTSAAFWHELEYRKYELKKPVKGVSIGNHGKAVLPKGTILHNLPGGLFAKHPDLADYKGHINNDEFGVLIRKDHQVLQDIEKNSKVLESTETVNEWGSSDQNIMNQQIHKDAGSPKKMPSPFDRKLRAAAEDAVDWHWDEWPEYKRDRAGLIDNAVRSYLRSYFPKDWAIMVRMFEPMESVQVTEAYSEDDINMSYGFYGAIDDNSNEKNAKKLFDQGIKDLKKKYKLTEEEALAVLNSKMGRKAADQIHDDQAKTAIEGLETYYGKDLKKQIAQVQRSMVAEAAGPGQWVAYIIYPRGKKLEKVLKSHRAAVMWNNKNVDSMLMQDGVEGIGIMSKEMWDQNEAEYAVESVQLNEGRSINKIQKEWGNVTAAMKMKVNSYKTAEGQEKEDLLDELKALTIAKKKLEAELDAAVGLKDLDAELAESTVNEMTSDAAIALADEVSGELYTARLKGKSVTINATTTTKTWEDGVPVLKHLARGKAKPVTFSLYQRPFKVVHDVAHNWFYFTDGGKWYGLHGDEGYFEPSDLPFTMEISESLNESIQYGFYYFPKANVDSSMQPAKGETKYAVICHNTVQMGRNIMYLKSANSSIGQNFNAHVLSIHDSEDEAFKAYQDAVKYDEGKTPSCVSFAYGTLTVKGSNLPFTEIGGERKTIK
jgi:hypothetical protein